jgi:hypothetical protein
VSLLPRISQLLNCRCAFQIACRSKANSPLFAVDSTTKFAADANGARLAIQKWNIWLRPVVAPFLPEIRRLNQHKTRGAQLLGPILKDCLARAQNEKPELEGFKDKQGSFISWVLKHTNQKERADPQVLGTNQMMCKSFLPVECVRSLQFPQCHLLQYTQQLWLHVTPFMTWLVEPSMSSLYARRSTKSSKKMVMMSTVKVS